MSKDEPIDAEVRGLAKRLERRRDRNVKAKRSFEVLAGCLEKESSSLQRGA
jgi:hypothetical protein